LKVGVDNSFGSAFWHPYAIEEVVRMAKMGMTRRQIRRVLRLARDYFNCQEVARKQTAAASRIQDNKRPRQDMLRVGTQWRARRPDNVDDGGPVLVTLDFALGDAIVFSRLRILFSCLAADFREPKKVLVSLCCQVITSGGSSSSSWL
jgi:hypothetical protein